MTDAVMDFDRNEHGFLPTSGGMRAALDDLARRKFPTHTQKRVEAEWDLSSEQAKGLLAGRASLNTIEQVLGHKRGGWTVGLVLVASVAGKRLSDFFASERSRLDHEAEQRRRRADELREAEGFLVSLDVGAMRSTGDHLGTR